MASTHLVERRDSVKSLEKALLAALTIARLQKVQVTTEDGRYRIVRMLGRGASGVVCEAIDRRMDRRIALKLYPGLAEDGHASAIRDEAKRLAKPQHPNVVVVHDYNAAHLRPGDIRCFYVAMELLDGDSLRQWLNVRRSPAEIVEVFCRAGEGLAAAHRVGLAHRDFKPENVVLVGETPKIVDFGLATDESLATTRLSTLDPDERMIVGTLAYMAPEALEGKASVRSDQFAFAAALWEALYGEFPYPIESVDPADRRKIETRRSDDIYPEGLRRCLARALNGDPRRRFGDMHAMVARLRELQPSLVDLVAPASQARLELSDMTTTVNPPSPRGRSWVRTLAPVFALAAAGVLAFFGIRGGLGLDLGEDANVEPPGALPLPVAGKLLDTLAEGMKASEEEQAVAPCTAEHWVGTWTFMTTPLWEQPGPSGLKGEYTLEIGPGTTGSTCTLALALTKTAVVGTSRTKLDHRVEFSADLERLGEREALLLTNVGPHQEGKAPPFLYDFAVLRDGDALIGDFYGARPDGAKPFSGVLRGGRKGADRTQPKRCDPRLAKHLTGDWRVIARDERTGSKVPAAEYAVSLKPVDCRFTIRRGGETVGSGVAYEKGLWRARVADGRLRREWTFTGTDTPTGRFRTLQANESEPLAEGSLSARRP